MTSDVIGADPPVKELGQRIVSKWIRFGLELLQFSLELSFQGSAHKDPIAVDLARKDPAPHFR